MTDRTLTRRRILQRLGLGMAAASSSLWLQGAGRIASASGKAHGWTYQGEGGPAHWGQLAPDYQACSRGKRQSPVDLAPAHLGSSPDVVLDWHPFRAKVTNNGHTIQLDPESGAVPAALTRGDRRFDFLQLHFHHPSEHALAGKRWPLEAHFVHKAASGGGLAVLGVMIRPGRANDLLGRILARAPAKAGTAALDGAIDLGEMMPNAAATYQYAGSLTTPPCSEIVDWVVFRDPIEAGIGQIESFARLFPMNARPLQPLGSRDVTIDFF